MAFFFNTLFKSSSHSSHGFVFLIESHLFTMCVCLSLFPYNVMSFVASIILSSAVQSVGVPFRNRQPSVIGPCGPTDGPTC